MKRVFLVIRSKQASIQSAPKGYLNRRVVKGKTNLALDAAARYDPLAKIITKTTTWFCRDKSGKKAIFHSKTFCKHVVQEQTNPSTRKTLPLSLWWAPLWANQPGDRVELVVVVVVQRWTYGAQQFRILDRMEIWRCKVCWWAHV